MPLVSDLRLVSKFLLFWLSVYALWLAVLDLSHADREWILDDRQSLVYVDVTTLTDRILEKYAEKTKFRIFPGYFMMGMKFISGMVLLIGLLTRPIIKLTIFSFMITSYDLIYKTSYYILSIYHLRNELGPTDFIRFLTDTTAWLLIQIAYVFLIHQHVEFLIANQIESDFKNRFPKYFKPEDESNVSRTKSSHIGKSSKQSKIPIKKQGLIQRWMQMWDNEPKSREGQSRIPVRRKISEIDNILDK